MGTLRSRLLRLAAAQSQLRPQLLPLLADTTNPEEIFARVMGSIAYLLTLNGHLKGEFDRWRLDASYKPSLELLKRSQQASETSRMARLAMADLVDLFPTTSKYVLAWTEVNRLDAEMALRMEEAKTMLKASR